MYKEIKLQTPTGEERTVPMLANAATPIRYKMLFGKDLLNAMMFSGGDIDIDILGRLAFVLSKQAAKANMSALSEDEYIEWLEDFDSMAFMNNAQEILSVYIGSQENASKAKK